MQPSRSLLVAPLFAALALGASCADPYDNVEMCTDYLLAADCGSLFTEEFATATCETYADLECDLSDFFECAAERVGCTEEGNLEGLDSAYAACANEASCL